VLTKLTALVLFWTSINAPSFGIKRSKFKVTVGSNMLENALLALLMRYLENYWTEFQTFSIDAFWDKERINFWGQNDKGQSHITTKG